MLAPPPTAFWHRHRLLWALSQVLAKQTERQDLRRIRIWQGRLRRVIRAPVQTYPWQRYWQAIRKQEADIPDDLLEAFVPIVDLVQDLWNEAAQVALSRTFVRNFDTVFAQTIFDEGITATMTQIRGIEETLRERLRDVLQQAMLEGADQWDFARRVRYLWDGVSRDRAEIIAWTEWARATERMGYATLRAGNVPFKAWLTVGDARVCPVCRGNAAQGAIPIEQPFASGHLHGPAHPRCRCQTQGLIHRE